MSAMERGRALLSTSDLRNSSDESAGHESAQTALPDRHGPDLDHHFVTFSPISDGMGTIDDDEHMHVVELDGTKVKPVDHGSIASILELREDEDDESTGSQLHTHTCWKAFLFARGGTYYSHSIHGSGTRQYRIFHDGTLQSEIK